jgi:hypothetical protein
MLGFSRIGGTRKMYKASRQGGRLRAWASRGKNRFGAIDRLEYSAIGDV